MDFKLCNEILSITVSSAGAELRSIYKDGTQYLWDGNPCYWRKQAPLLFPFVGRFTEGSYCFRGRNYQMNIHGFAAKKEFTAGNQDQNSITFRLEDDEETRASYPFRFLLEVSYTLTGSTINIVYTVHNKTKDMMYFGIGGHPGFRVPLEDELSFSDYYLDFGIPHTPDRIGHSPSCFLDGTHKQFPLEGERKLRLQHEMFDEDAIVLGNVADEVTLKSDHSAKKITVSYPQMLYLGLWHAPRTKAPYLCIEPWTSLPSRQDIVEDLQCKSDLIRLKGHEEYRNEWSITVT